MSKVVCYTLTRNLYLNIQPSLKSLLKNGNIDRVYLFIEDDDIGYELPPGVYTINVGDQQIFPKDGPNYNARWTYMAMMKAAMSKLLTRDKVLTLDVDTIVLGDLSPLWDIDFGPCYLAGAIEPYWSRCGNPYVNLGVILWNLDKLRAMKKDDEIIWMLNHQKFDLLEQECVNKACSGEIYVVGPEWNAGGWTGMPEDESKIRVRHFMAYGQEKFQQEPLVKKYAAMSWEDTGWA